MGKAPGWFWYPKDCDTDERVRAMNDQEFGFYMRCLNHAWMNRSIPADLDQLARVLGRSPAYVRRVWERVGPCFDPVDTLDDTISSRLVNPKQESQRISQKLVSDTMRDAALTRWKQKNSIEQKQSFPIPIAIPTAKQVKSICASPNGDGALPFDTLDPRDAPGKDQKPPGEEPGNFEAFWAQYPRRTCKQLARTQFSKARKSTHRKS